MKRTIKPWSNDANFSHKNTKHLLSRKSLNRLTTLFGHVVVSCCVTFARVQNVLATNVVRQNISFVFRNVVHLAWPLFKLCWLCASAKFGKMFSLHKRTTCNNIATNRDHTLCIVGWKVWITWPRLKSHRNWFPWGKENKAWLISRIKKIHYKGREEDGYGNYLPKIWKNLSMQIVPGDFGGKCS